MAPDLSKMSDADLHEYTRVRYGISKRSRHAVPMWNLVLNALMEWKGRGKEESYHRAVQQEEDADRLTDEMNRKAFESIRSKI